MATGIVVAYYPGPQNLDIDHSAFWRRSRSGLFIKVPGYRSLTTLATSSRLFRTVFDRDVNQFPFFSQITVLITLELAWRSRASWHETHFQRFAKGTLSLENQGYLANLDPPPQPPQPRFFLPANPILRGVVGRAAAARCEV
jgi:hypothetical protein